MPHPGGLPHQRLPCVLCLQHPPEQGRGTSRSVSGDRRQAMQASMASCQGSSSASGKSTSRIRILGSRGGRRDTQRVSETPLTPPPPPITTTSPPHHLRTARCRALLAAGVSRLCISARKGWGCCRSSSSSDLTSLSWAPSELRACSRSRTIFPAGPQPSTRRRRGLRGHCVGGSFSTGRGKSQGLATVSDVKDQKRTNS